MLARLVAIACLATASAEVLPAMRLRGGYRPGLALSAPSAVVAAPAGKSELTASGGGGVDYALIFYFAGW